MWEHEQDGSTATTARDEGDPASIAEATAPDLWLWLPQVVPQAAWKCWAVGIAAAVGWIGLLFGWHSAEQASLAGSVSGDLLAPFCDQCLRGSGALAWLLAGQLCCVVWWVRSRSHVDYGGRFYAWAWTAAGFFAASMLCLTNTHRVLAAWVSWSVFGATANSTGVTALWLLPLLVAGFVLWANLGAEFRNDLSSRVLHSLGAVCVLALIDVELWNVRTGSVAQWEFVSRVLLASLQWCHLMSVWLHVRHVVHVSADPPALSASGWLLAWRYGPGRVMSAFTRHAAEEPIGDKLDETVTEGGKKRIRVDSADGTSQEVRIDDAEPTAKGPNKRSRQAARK